MGNLNIIELEKQKDFLNEQLALSRSVKRRALLIYNFYETLNKTNDENAKEVYTLEFIDEFLACLVHLKSLSIHQRLLGLLLNTLDSLQSKPYLKEYHQQIQQLKENAEEQITNLKDILNGKRHEYSHERKIFFPVLEAERYNDSLIFSSLESLTITIEKTKNKNSFLIIPRERELEGKIERQVENSWTAALDFCRKYIKKISPAHKVLIYFDKMQGIYSGNSLGIALTLGFIEELLKIYNAPTVVKIKEGIAFTGGMDCYGNITEVSSEIIEKKPECIFFSPIETFVVHKNDEPYSQKKLKELKNEFPGRNLEIISVSSLTDLLNRRNLVDIRKQNTFTRASNRARENVVSLMLGFVLLLVIILSGIWDLDDNPARLVNEGNILHVKNKNNKLLWTKEMVFELQTQHENIIPFSEKLVDINDDGINEIIICNELLINQ